MTELSTNTKYKPVTYKYVATGERTAGGKGEIVEVHIQYENEESQYYEHKPEIDEEGFPIPEPHEYAEEEVIRTRGYSASTMGEDEQGSKKKKKKKKKKKIYKLSEEGEILDIEEVELGAGEDDTPDNKLKAARESGDFINEAEYAESSSDAESVVINIDLVPESSIMKLKDDEEWVEEEVEEEFTEYDEVMMEEKVFYKRVVKIFKRKKKYPLAFPKYFIRESQEGEICEEESEMVEETVSEREVASVDELRGKPRIDVTHSGKINLLPGRDDMLSIISQPEDFYPPIAHIPGIGPIIPEPQISSVVDFMRLHAKKQAGYVMPRNIRHFLCPPLDVEYRLWESGSCDSNRILDTENNPLVDYCCNLRICPDEDKPDDSCKDKEITNAMQESVSKTSSIPYRNSSLKIKTPLISPFDICERFEELGEEYDVRDEEPLEQKDEELSYISKKTLEKEIMMIKLDEEQTTEDEAQEEVVHIDENDMVPNEEHLNLDEIDEQVSYVKDGSELMPHEEEEIDMNPSEPEISERDVLDPDVPEEE